MHFKRPLIEIFQLLSSTLSAIIVVLIVAAATRHVTLGIPGPSQNFMEWLIEIVQNIMMNTLGNKENIFIL